MQRATPMGAVARGRFEGGCQGAQPGIALLKRSLEDESIGAGGLLLGALGPTAMAATAFLLL